MAVSNVESAVIRLGDGIAVSFDFDIEAVSAASIKVGYIVGVTVVKAAPATYSVVMNGALTGGVVTFTVAPVAATKIYIYRETDQTQVVSVSRQQAYNPAVVERVWDKLTLLIQELSTAVKRSVKTGPDANPDQLVSTLESARDNALAAAAAASASAGQAALFDGPWVADVAALVANTSLTYAASTSSSVAVGSFVRTRAEGFSYRVAAAAAADHHITTAGGVKLYVLPDEGGWYNFSAMAPAADGVTNDFAKLAKLLAIRLPNGSSNNPKGASIFIPSGSYYIDNGANGIQLKAVTHLRGEAPGQNNSSVGTRLVFPTGCIGITVNRFNTLNGGQEGSPTGGADGSVIEGLALTSTVDSNKASHAIWMRARAVVTRCFIAGWGGNGVNIVASFNGDATSIGNANCFRVDTIRVQGCEHGVYAAGADANAGHGYSIDAASNRRWGIWDASFLGNEWTGCHVEGNGSDTINGQSAYATFGGQSYHAVPGATEQQLVGTQPGTNANIWRVCRSAVDQIAWTGANPLGTYRQGGGYHSSNLNARCTFTGCYAEGGQGVTWLSQHSIALGGFFVEVPVASGAAIEGRFSANWSREPFVSERARISDGRTIMAATGGDANSLAAFEWADSINNQTYRWQASGTLGTFEMTRQGGAIGIAVRGPNETQLPNYFQLAGLGLGFGGTLRAFGRTTWSTANGVVFPTSGSYNKGDIGLAPNPDAGGKIGWVCTTSGVAGSTAVFKPFGAIDA